MNGRDLTLGLVGALAVGAALGRARGSRSTAKAMGWTREPVILLQEPIRKLGRVSGDTGLWLRAQRMDYPDGRQLAVFVLEDPDADTSTQDEGDEAVLGHVLADDVQIYARSTSLREAILPACADALADLRRSGIVRGLYLVGNTELDSRFHGRGIGSAMYDALIRAAWSDHYAVSPHWCAPRGSVSDAAMRVWSKLARRYPHVGDPDYMRAEEDDHDPEALAQAGTPPIVWGGGGSYNRATDLPSTPAFRHWFGESKVVDEAGRPLVVFHGTGATFDTFDKKMRGFVTESSDSKTGFFFTSSLQRAEDAAQDAAWMTKPEAWSRPAPDAARVMRVYLKMERPLVRYDMQDDPADTARIIRAAKRAGHDGLIWMQGERGGRDYVVFEPTQIKSATSNRGTFDPADPRISFNRAPATDAALRTLRAAMVKAARADTAFSPAKWKRAKDPLTGHCHAVAHVVRDRFGGELVKGTVKGQAHAWNRLPGGREVDLSGSQYGGDGLHPLAKGEVTSWPKTVNPRFARFATRVDAQLALR